MKRGINFYLEFKEKEELYNSIVETGLVDVIPAEELVVPVVVDPGFVNRNLPKNFKGDFIDIRTPKLVKLRDCIVLQFASTTWEAEFRALKQTYRFNHILPNDWTVIVVSYNTEQKSRPELEEIEIKTPRNLTVTNQIIKPYSSS